MFSQSYNIFTYPTAGGSRKTWHALAKVSLEAYFNLLPHQMKVHDFTCRSQRIFLNKHCGDLIKKSNI